MLQLRLLGGATLEDDSGQARRKDLPESLLSLSGVSGGGVTKTTVVPGGSGEEKSGKSMFGPRVRGYLRPTVGDGGGSPSGGKGVPETGLRDGPGGDFGI